jgi:hypothetical protein
MKAVICEMMVSTEIGFVDETGNNLKVTGTTRGIY